MKQLAEKEFTGDERDQDRLNREEKEEERRKQISTLDQSM